MNPSSLKVSELQSELKERGLKSTGMKKAELIAALEEALANEEKAKKESKPAAAPEEKVCTIFCSAPSYHRLLPLSLLLLRILLPALPKLLLQAVRQMRRRFVS